LVDFDGAALTKLRERAADNATLIVPALAGREIRKPRTRLSGVDLACPLINLMTSE
jgi:hypothetical protein